ncbi:MAG: hypothetical protein EXS15_03385 [Phycisphaerales bacterium]|nr:hypothetical protein [Phycisphaerales bacterium]
MLGTLVYFGENLMIRVGEEKNGVKVIAVEPPSNVRVEHLRGSYSVPIWLPTDWSKLSGSSPPAHSPIARSSSPAGGTSGITPSVVASPKSATSAESMPSAKVQPAVEPGAAPSKPGEVDTEDEVNPDSPDAARATPRPTQPRSAAQGDAITPHDESANISSNHRTTTPFPNRLNLNLEHSL